MCSCFKRKSSKSEEQSLDEENLNSEVLKSSTDVRTGAIEEFSHKVEMKMLPATSSRSEQQAREASSEKKASQNIEKNVISQSRGCVNKDDIQSKQVNFLELEVRPDEDLVDDEGKNGDSFSTREPVLVPVHSETQTESLDLTSIHDGPSLSLIDKVVSTITTEDPFDPKYELWKVAVNRAKVRLDETRKSRKVCEFPNGTIVRCVARAAGSYRFKIDLPLRGWCSFYCQTRVSQKDDSLSVRRVNVFKRVDPLQLTVVDSRFVLEIKIGQGSFGKVFVAWDQQERRKVAVKIDQPKNNKRSVFYREIDIMKVVLNCKRVPRLLCHGSISSHTRGGRNMPEKESFVNQKFMVLDLQGMSLSILWKNYITFFSLKTVLMLGIEIVRILQEVHATGVLHRDIKPANFVISRGDQGRNIYILDFGLSVMYTGKDGSHVDYREGCRRCGTARYSSINTHKRIRQSRRDDLEAAGYVLLLFLRDLPWKQKKGEAPDKKWKRILHEKLKFTPSVLCDNFDESVQELFISYFEYCRTLEFNAQPNYDYLVNLFAQALAERQLTLDFNYDWVDILFSPSST